MLIHVQGSEDLIEVSGNLISIISRTRDTSDLLIEFPLSCRDCHCFVPEELVTVAVSRHDKEGETKANIRILEGSGG